MRRRRSMRSAKASTATRSPRPIPRRRSASEAARAWSSLLRVPSREAMGRPQSRGGPAGTVLAQGVGLAADAFEARRRLAELAAVGEGEEATHLAAPSHLRVDAYSRGGEELALAAGE